MDKIPEINQKCKKGQECKKHEQLCKIKKNQIFTICSTALEENLGFFVWTTPSQQWFECCSHHRCEIHAHDLCEEHDDGVVGHVIQPQIDHLRGPANVKLANRSHTARNLVHQINLKMKWTAAGDADRALGRCREEKKNLVN